MLYLNTINIQNVSKMFAMGATVLAISCGSPIGKNMDDEVNNQAEKPFVGRLLENDDDKIKSLNPKTKNKRKKKWKKKNQDDGNAEKMPYEERLKRVQGIKNCIEKQGLRLTRPDFEVANLFQGFWHWKSNEEMAKMIIQHGCHTTVDTEDETYVKYLNAQKCKK